MEDNTGDRTVEQPIGTRTRVPPRTRTRVSPEQHVEEPEEAPIATRTRVPRR